MVVILGSQGAVVRMVKNDWVVRRYSGLKARLQSVFSSMDADA